jgi:hypothetical protein
MRPHLRVRAVAVYAVAPMKPEEMLVDVLPMVTALEWMLTVLAEFSHAGTLPFRLALSQSLQQNI